MAGPILLLWGWSLTCAVEKEEGRKKKPLSPVANVDAHVACFVCICFCHNQVWGVHIYYWERWVFSFLPYSLSPAQVGLHSHRGNLGLPISLPTLVKVHVTTQVVCSTCEAHNN